MVRSKFTISRVAILQKPYSQACENNKGPILRELTRVFGKCKNVLEIGSGTGQHAVYFAASLAHLTWHTSDQTCNHDGINRWITDSPANNLQRPISLTIGQDPWPELDIDGVFSANTAHIMQPNEAKLMMQMIAENLPNNGIFCQYGPFKFEGQYTSESNAAFDQHLLSEGCGGIRDIADLEIWAKPLQLQNVIAMPANNFVLIWQKH
ncbi:DUF938 domain-containing protein [Paraglaciecola aquimarina]|uniref:DUF938 domain-containing protein n=1 Tax=Paraglaciecola aquimarina TaxID=1235557 RepID=A0ABU3T059_9ALTE|nr:DUF938 domain-containing protein [Paraglaciecola aquimarina]MDU0355657.1 DUF938 domain-containing protein [Paraglaciecola aquimarina]